MREPAVIHDGIYDTGMHKVSIIAKLSKFDQLKSALNDLGVTGMTVTQVMGCGIQKGTTEHSSKPRSFAQGSGAFDLLLTRTKKEKEKGERSICHAGRRELCRSSRAAAAAGTAEKLVERYSTSCSAA